MATTKLNEEKPYKYQIYCNPGNGIFRCWAERYGAPEAYIRELYNKYFPADRDINILTQYRAMLSFYHELTSNFSQLRRYCDYCEDKARG